MIFGTNCFIFCICCINFANTLPIEYLTRILLASAAQRNLLSLMTEHNMQIKHDGSECSHVTSLILGKEYVTYVIICSSLINVNNFQPFLKAFMNNWSVWKKISFHDSEGIQKSTYKDQPLVFLKQTYIHFISSIRMQT